MAVQKESKKLIHRADEEILKDIWQALWQKDTIQAIDRQDISIAVERGQVCLSGHITNELLNQSIEAITWSIPGVVAVHNHLVTDHDLSLQVAQALSDDKRTRPFLLPVICDHGWVKLGGSVPNQDIQRAAEATAASVPQVRGVILLPDVMGQHTTPERDTIQPGIGMRVYGEDEIEETIYQVVVNPQNRLVTHAIVRANEPANGRAAWFDYLVPVEFIQIAEKGGIFLNQKTNVLRQFSIFNPTQYPFAPLTWQPPYPYQVGNVRWPRQAQSGGTKAFIAVV